MSSIIYYLEEYNLNKQAYDCSKTIYEEMRHKCIKKKAYFDEFTS